MRNDEMNIINYIDHDRVTKKYKSSFIIENQKIIYLLLGSCAWITEATTRILIDYTEFDDHIDKT